MKDTLVFLCLALGTVLILSQVVLAFFPRPPVKVPNPELLGTASAIEKLLDAAAKFADKAPLMGGGLILFILAAVLTGDISISASTESK